MLPVSLLFSSDQETSRQLSQALRELELEVEYCPVIFDALQKLTNRTLDVIVVDWDEGLEAGFLLKTAREMTSNRRAFPIAIADAGATGSARQAGAKIVLTKPIESTQVKYALLSCDEFLQHMRTWFSQVAPEAPPPSTSQRLHETSSNESWPPTVREARVPQSLPVRRLEPSPNPPAVAAPGTFPDLTFATLENEVLQGPDIETLFRSKSSRTKSSSPNTHKRPIWGLMRGIAITTAILSAGYVFSQPVHANAMAASVAEICGRALEKTQAWLQTSERQTPEWIEVDESAKAASPRTGSTRVHVMPAVPILDDTRTTEQLASLQAPQITSRPQPRLQIPESLRAPMPMNGSTTDRSMTGRLLAGLEPVSVAEEFSAGLILDKVQPSYPKQALQAGLQGPVVLQVWIAKDGTIRELKLIRGSLLLGEAAYEAVKQWRYKPYLRNGQAVEAQTYVTVDFRLP